MALLIDSVRRNFGLKVTAVVVAVVLWFTFNLVGTSHNVFSKTLVLPVTVHGIASGLVAMPQTDHVTVVLEGPRPDVESETASDLAAYVDCANRAAGIVTLPVGVAGRDADKIMTVTPDQSVVVIDRYAYRAVPVAIRGADGGALADAIVAPAAIQVAGAASAVARVIAAEASVPETRALPAGFMAELKATPVDAHLQPVDGATAVGLVRVTSTATKEQKAR